MSKELEFLAKAVSEKTPGDWHRQYTEEEHSEIIKGIAEMISKGGNQWYWVTCDHTHPGDTATLTVTETGNGPTSAKNAAFIALAGTIAKELLAVVEAAELVNQPQLHAKALDSLAAKLEALKAKIKEQMG